MMRSTIAALLRERASLQPNDAAFTFIGYDNDGGAVPETVTWLELFRRSTKVAAELMASGSAGDRAVIVAPQSLDYIAAFVGSIQAGRIAVPLSVPQPGVHDERVVSVLRDTAPKVVLTTSSELPAVTEYARSTPSAPAVVAVDSLDAKSPAKSSRRLDAHHETAYLQYTSGSTREPAGVIVTHTNLSANFDQMYADFFVDYGKVAPPHTTIVSWLPFYHDMGLLLGICVPILGGLRSVVMSPMSFLQRPGRWIEQLAAHPRALSAAPNFAFELAARRTSDDELATLDLSDVLGVLSGAERVQPATLQRFTRRFGRHGFCDNAIRPSYGLAEATVYVATRRPGEPPEVAHFAPDKLSAGQAKRCTPGSGTPLVSYGTPESTTVRIVDPQTSSECPPGITGEIWVHGANVAAGYWNKPKETRETFGARILTPTPDTPESPWLRTGDLGFISDGELFIVGRIKDMLIVYGRNHYPEDIEATIQEVNPGRCAAIAVADGSDERLVAIVESKTKAVSDGEAMARTAAIERDVTAAISQSHGLTVADIVLVEPGSIPITTSGKIRRSTCVELYRRHQFIRINSDR